MNHDAVISVRVSFVLEHGLEAGWAIHTELRHPVDIDTIAEDKVTITATFAVSPEVIVSVQVE